MNIKELFDKYYERLSREAWLKSLLCGLTVGFVVNFVVAFICWFLDANGLWWSIGALVAVTAGMTPLFYYKRFKPTTEQVAKRLDRLGLEERMITMTELVNNESYIAQRQREDAREKLHSVNTSNIRFAFSRLSIILLCVFGVLGLGMTTVTGLSSEGIISSGKDVFEEILPDEPVVTVTVQYIVGEGAGMIEGDEVQILELGENATEVIAVADDGFTFVEWSDGISDPARTDYGIEADVIYEAIFAEIGDGDGDGNGEGEGEGDGGGEGNEPGKSDKPSDEEGEPNLGANGAYEENNMIKDGNTYYRDILEAGGFYEAAMEWLQSGEDLPEELRIFIQTYFEVIV